jgi:hypothetical protein
MNILLLTLIPHADEITGAHQCEFLRNTPMTAHIFYIRQTQETKWEYNGAVLQLFIHLKKLGYKYYTIFPVSLKYTGNKLA